MSDREYHSGQIHPQLQRQGPTTRGTSHGRDDRGVQGAIRGAVGNQIDERCQAVARRHGDRLAVGQVRAVVPMIPVIEPSPTMRAPQPMASRAACSMSSSARPGSPRIPRIHRDLVEAPFGPGASGRDQPFKRVGDPRIHQPSVRDRSVPGLECGMCRRRTRAGRSAPRSAATGRPGPAPSDPWSARIAGGSGRRIASPFPKRRCKPLVPARELTRPAATSPPLSLGGTPDDRRGCWPPTGQFWRSHPPDSAHPPSRQNRYSQ